MKTKSILNLFILILISSCTQKSIKTDNEFKYMTEQFEDLKIIRYKVPGFSELDLRQKKLIYYLSQASLSGRDIIFDQNYRHNLKIRRTLEAIVANYKGDRTSKDFINFITYTKDSGSQVEFITTTQAQSLLQNLVLTISLTN